MKRCILCLCPPTHKIAFTFQCQKDGATEILTVMSVPFCEACIDRYLGYIAEGPLDREIFDNLTQNIVKSGYSVSATDVKREKVTLDFSPNKEWVPITYCCKCGTDPELYKIVMRIPMIDKEKRECSAYVETAGFCAACIPTDPTVDHLNPEQLAHAFKMILEIGGQYDAEHCQITVAKMNWRPTTDATTISKDIQAEYAKARREALQGKAGEIMKDMRETIEDHRRKAANALNN